MGRASLYKLREELRKNCEDRVQKLQGSWNEIAFTHAQTQLPLVFVVFARLKVISSPYCALSRVLF